MAMATVTMTVMADVMGTMTVTLKVTVTVLKQSVLSLQDHIVSGVWMTKRDTFLSKAEYMQLVYAACSPTRPGLLDASDHIILPPTIFKPEPLYTGKQASHC
jgi:regulation of enolase protein 1 (concanavalin A-like superfamily)